MQEITTPNYPNTYSNSKTCTWNIDAAQGSRVELKFVAFDLEYGSSCQYDWLKVYDGANTGRAIGNTLCGSSKPSNIVSSGNLLFLKWHSDSSTAKSGFKI